MPDPLVDRFKEAVAITSRRPSSSDDSDLDLITNELVEAGRALVAAGRRQEVGKLSIAALDEYDDQRLGGAILWAAQRSDDEKYARLTPQVERVTLDAEINVGPFTRLRVSKTGAPVVDQDEPVRSRWLGAALFVIDIARESSGDDQTGDTIAEGGLRFAVTDRRILGTFNSARTEHWGNIQSEGGGTGSPAVLAFSWPLAGLTAVRVPLKSTLFRKPVPAGLEMLQLEPMAFMRLMAVTAVDEQWLGSRDANVGEWQAAANSIASTAATVRLAQGSDQDAALRAIAAGQWVQAGNTLVARLVAE